MKLATRHYSNRHGGANLGRLESLTNGPVPAAVAGIPMPTTVNEALALNDSQLSAVLHRIDLLSHHPRTGVAFHRFQKLALLFAYAGVPRNFCVHIFTNAPAAIPPSTEPNVTIYQALNFNEFSPLFPCY